MTSKKSTETTTAEVEATEIDLDAAWLRENSLTAAINFHKNNGGIMTAEQLLVTAAKFLAFTKGEQ